MAGTKITVKKDGSLRVEGDFEICDPEGNAFDAGVEPSLREADFAEGLQLAFIGERITHEPPTDEFVGEVDEAR